MEGLLNIGILGLGEAGKIFASDLAKVSNVTGFDPYWNGVADGYTVVGSAADCISGADVVIALTAAPQALELFSSVLADLGPDSVYADFSSASPAQKAETGRLAEGRVLFADAVLLAPVPAKRIATAAQASGTGAGRLASLLNPLGMTIERIDGEAGQAAARKLLRSILIKGLTALMIESLRTAEVEGLLDWFSDHLLETLTGITQPFLVRLIEGTLGHSERRIHEMEAAAEMVESSGANASMTRAIVEVLKTATDGIPRSEALR
jgi:3-hydroxyisobutyrate dehydrogenase-like beta-hydroxyacid dehydrogenase